MGKRNRNSPPNTLLSKPTRRFISLRDSLKGAVGDFLNDEGMACINTEAGLVEMISALSHYREEGTSLFPQIFIMDDLKTVSQLLPGGEFISVGDGERSAATMTKALKQCAPLTQGGWSIYILRKPNRFNYGVFRTGGGALSESPEETLVERGDSTVPVVLVYQVAESVVEVRGAALKSSLSIHFRASRESEPATTLALRSLASQVTDRCSEKIKEQTLNFYFSVFSDVLKIGHGTLAAVISNRREALPPSMGDGVILRPPVDVPKRIQDALSTRDAASHTRLQAYASLIRGMMYTDGITVFACDGCVRAFNVFVQHQEGRRSSGTPAGGARSRTYDTLCAMIGRGLIAAYMQSHDGRVEFRGQRS